VGTVPANADSNAVAAARAWAAAASACPAAALNHATYGVAAAAIDSDAGPDHGPLVNPVTTESNDDAAPAKSVASPCQADAATNSGPEPAPANISAELSSGGYKVKAGIITTPTHPAASTAPTTASSRTRPQRLGARLSPQLERKAITHRKAGVSPNDFHQSEGGFGTRSPTAVN